MSREDLKFFKWRPHPWHGLRTGPRPPDLVDVYVEITPFDLIKYEIDKETGYLRIDRPQQGASLPPTVYGFIPKTYCGRRVGEISNAKDGDGDPLDVCVLMERPPERAEIVLTAKVVGSIQMLDDEKADDKIIAVLERDGLWGDIDDVSEIPDILVDRLKHYFLTYKGAPTHRSRIELEGVFNAQRAREVVAASMDDYRESFGRHES